MALITSTQAGALMAQYAISESALTEIISEISPYVQNVREGYQMIQYAAQQYKNLPSFTPFWQAVSDAKDKTVAYFRGNKLKRKGYWEKDLNDRYWVPAKKIKFSFINANIRKYRY